MKIHTEEIKNSVLSHWSDYTGIIASVLCFVHCWTLPIVILFLPGLMAHNELVHPLLGCAAILSTLPLFFRKSKKLNKLVFTVMIIGNLMLLIMLMSHDHLNFISEVILSTTGGSLLVYVHYRQLSSRKTHSH